MLNRVVVTGLGVLSPNGNDVKSFWSNIVNGITQVNEITRFDVNLFRTHFAGQIHNYDAAAYFDKGMIKKTDLFTQYAIIASDQAIRDSGFDFKKMDPFDVGVI